MRVKELGTRSVSASVREFLSRLGREPQPTVRVERRQIPYWQERGWARQGRTYSGNYQTPYGAFQGWVEQEISGDLTFYFYNPPAAVKQGGHWSCFQHRGNDWYFVHMARKPKDLGSGIMIIEKLIKEAYER